MVRLKQVRSAFPILDQEVHGEALIYLDNAATTQKPQSVLDGVRQYYAQDNANIHRGIHTLAQRATEAYEGARTKLAAFIGADREEVIFHRGTTEGLNFLVRSLVEPRLTNHSKVFTTRLEHHSSLVPVQALCQRTGAELVFLPLDRDFRVDLAALDQVDTTHGEALVIQHVSNVLGQAQDIAAIVAWAHAHNILVIVDGAQAAGKRPLNLHHLGVDGYAFSGHKMYGPTGIGVTYLARRHHATTPPLFYGGEMIHVVADATADYKASPWKYEAGTMPIAQAIGLALAVDMLNALGWDALQAHEASLGRRLYQGLAAMDGVTLYGPMDPNGTVRHGIVAFNLDGIHPHDAASAYDLEGIALRAGHHCCQPLMRLLEIDACLRVSVAVYNTLAEVDRFLAVTAKVRDFFHGA